MDIAFFTDSYFPEIDGVAYTVKSWKKKLEERGNTVHIVYPRSEDYEPGENEIPTKSVPNPFYGGYNIPVPTNLDFPEVDLVHCHSPATLGLAGRLYAWRSGVPAVYTHHTPLEEYFVQAVKSQLLAKGLGKVYVPLESRFLASFDAVTSSTDRINRSVDHIKLPVGVDTEFFSPQEDTLTDELGVKRPTAGYSGRISQEKHVDELVKFAERFGGTLIVVGDGPAKQELMEGSTENVMFRDWLEREKLPSFYSGLDVFVTASIGDTLGLSTLEANACGTPVVAPDVPPFNETIGPENGLRYEAGNIDSLESSVEEAVRKEFDTRGAIEKYSLAETVDRLEELYRQLV